ncbi:MAG: response regulator [Rhodospirillaceae bacterium]|jgi:two-component system, chemotaxis family, chemotaxis protein CheY|nr:response regulator [Rhodospirillaceae bacterium]MBT5459227.1 response regulator [Rhodospirillaceae bacterium]
MKSTEIDFREIKVLLIDDSRHMRLIIKSILLGLGCKQIREAGDAAVAFKEMQSFTANLIIVDWFMEPLDGLEFVRLVRTAEDSPDPYIPIIMLSGFTEFQRVAEARDAGVNEFLAKPVSVQLLGRRIESIINNPRQFIRTKNYFGPCRRRNDYGPPRGKTERRVADAEEKSVFDIPIDSTDASTEDL